MRTYKVTIGNIVYLYDNEKDARKAYHMAVAKNGINNVQVSYEDGKTVYEHTYT